MEPQLEQKPGDPVLTADQHRKTMLGKINNLTNAAINAYKTAGDLSSFATQLRSVIREAVEVGVEYEKAVATSSGAPVSRPSVDSKGKTKAPSKTVQEEPAAEPQVIVATKPMIMSDGNAERQKAAEAAAKL